MFHKYFLILLLFLSNCAGPGAALFAPTITGVATESLARASLSFTTSQIMESVKKPNHKKDSNLQSVLHK